MNTVEVATWIQEGLIAANERDFSSVRDRDKWIIGQVLRKARGKMNPNIIQDFINMETSIPCKMGWTLC
jgi:Asp-tRNA(Asn)/Glu-tRNA(Gln) amidotransferase B subunit